MRDNFYNAFSLQFVQSQRIVIKTLGNIVKELKITHEENLCFTSRCLNKIDYRKFIDFFFRPRDAFKFKVRGIDVGDITEVRIKSERKIITDASWELRKVQ